MKTIAIIGQSASGKSELAHALARKHGAALLSMDSLGVYRHIEIASAKPTAQERAGLTYFGIDLAEPSERFGVDDFALEYLRAREFCLRRDRDLIIVGGSSFYLKALLDGLSPLPPITQAVKNMCAQLLERLPIAYDRLCAIDSVYAAKIKPADRYRIEKALLIAFGSNMKPSEWFALNPPKPIASDIAIVYPQIPLEMLREKIAIRTQNMLRRGLIDETRNLLNIAPLGQPIKAIGIAETVMHLENKIDLAELEKLINIHTAQLAKRQRTFNNAQFRNVLTVDYRVAFERVQQLLD
ncbi:MAG: tRNA (adenosine(37)-N6)-dimethylallyltransferase MiaA [Helicobacteraceae bacterium]|jgi:tRNA dimethylallyltransferase|nr:tRNA (adenosine(37)-N6)-dimethylallyltransferase MiaA [Helicobacteraceae bacterium]